MSEIATGVIVGLVVGGIVGWVILDNWHRLGGPDKDDP